jgi:amino acid transporter
MKNETLTSNDHSKLFISHVKLTVFAIFTLLLCLFFGAGVIPALLLCYSIYMKKKTDEFIYIDKAVELITKYLMVCLAIGVISFIFVFYHHGWNPDSFGPILAIVLTIAYYYALRHLFYLTLKNYPKSAQTSPAHPIIKSEDHNDISVADELIKWAKLKEDGHISEEEFQEARDELLKKH